MAGCCRGKRPIVLGRPSLFSCGGKPVERKAGTEMQLYIQREVTHTHTHTHTHMHDNANHHSFSLCKDWRAFPRDPST